MPRACARLEVELHALGGRATVDPAVRHPRRALLAEAHVTARLEHDRLVLVEAHAAQLGHVGMSYGFMCIRLRQRQRECGAH